MPAIVAPEPEALAGAFGRLEPAESPAATKGSSIELQMSGVVVRVGRDADAGVIATVIGAMKSSSQSVPLAPYASCWRPQGDGLPRTVDAREPGQRPVFRHGLRLSRQEGGPAETPVLRRHRDGAGCQASCGGRFPLAQPGYAVIRLTAAEMAAPIDGLDWWRVHVPRETVTPVLAG